MAATETDIANAALVRLGHVPLAGLVSDTSDLSKARTLMDGAYLAIRDEVIRSQPWNCLKKRVQLTGATVTGITAANPGVITTFADHGFVVGEQVNLNDLEGMDEYEDTTFVINTTPATTTFTTKDKTTGVATDSTAFTAYSGPGDGTDTGRAVLMPLFGYGQSFPLPADFFRLLNVEDSRKDWVVEGNRILADEGVVDFRYIGHPKARTATDPADNFYDPLFVSVLTQRLALENVEALTQSNTKKQALTLEYLDLIDQATMVNIQEQSPKGIEPSEWLLERR